MNFTNEFHICVRVCGVEGRGKTLSGQGLRWPGGIDHEVTRGHVVALRRNGISNCLFRVRHISSDTCFCKSEQQLPSSSSTLSSSDSSGAWISSHFRIEVRSPDECVAPGRRQPRETHWTFDGLLSSPLFFLQYLLSQMFLSFMVRTSPLRSVALQRFTAQTQPITWLGLHVFRVAECWGWENFLFTEHSKGVQSWAKLAVVLFMQAYAPVLIFSVFKERTLIRKQKHLSLLGVQLALSERSRCKTEYKRRR